MSDEDRPNQRPTRASDGAAFAAATRSSRRAPGVVVVAAVAVVALAVAAAQLSADPGPSASVSPATSGPATSAAGPVTTTSPDPAVAPPPTAPSVAPDRDPTVSPHPTVALEPTPAGPVPLVAAGAPQIGITVTIPDGWARAGDAMLVKTDGLAPGSVSIGAWRVEDVFVFPCRWAGGDVVDPALMGTAAGQAQALSSWWGQDPGKPPDSNVRIAPIANRPTPWSIAGRNAWFVDVLVVRDFDFDACDGGQLVFWRAANGDVRIGVDQGELHRLWTLDIDGEVLLIDATSSTSASPIDQTELLRVISSMVIESSSR